MKGPLLSELRMIEPTLDIMNTKAHMLVKTSPESVTESGHLCLIWNRHFNLLLTHKFFRGESTSDNSTMNKKELYAGHKNVIAFKTDIRFVVDHNSAEIDMATGEVAKDDMSKKAIDDEGKLYSEGSDIVDNLLNIAPFKKEESCTC
ncbi:hypothetical protein V8B55DRAFT_1442026 [Mucor lusitanicus]